MTHPKTISTIVLAVLISALSVGCGGDSTAPAPSAEGTYSLRSVDGKSLPWVMLDNSEIRYELTAGTFLLKPGGACTSSITQRQTSKSSNAVGSFSEESSCAYEIAGTVITITSPDFSTLTGTVSDGRLTVTDHLMFVYTK